MNGVHPCDFTMSPVASYIFVLIQPRTWPPPLNHTVSFASNPNSGWCVSKQVLSGVYLPAFGSHTAACRSDSLIGNAFADGWSEPGRQILRVLASARRGRQPDASLAVDHRVVVVDARIPDRFVAPVRGRLHRGEGRGVSRPEAQRHVRIAAPVAWNVVATFFTGSRTGRLSVLYSGEPYSGP